MQKVSKRARQTTVFYLEFPPFQSDPIVVLNEEEYWTDELLPGYSYQKVSIPGDYPTPGAFWKWVEEENEARHEFWC